MQVGDIVKIKKQYDSGTIDVRITKIYSDTKILCENEKIHCPVMISKCDIIDKQYFINQVRMAQSIARNKREYYCEATTSLIKQNIDCSDDIFMI